MNRTSGMSKGTILIMAGGTGGHVFPALAVAKAMHKLGWKIEWLGTRQGMEADLVPKASFPIHYISVTGFRREGILKRLLTPLRLSIALIQSILLLRKLKPNVVLGMGGFAAGPGGIAAWICRVPLVIHEQNAIAGTTNRILARLATQVLEGFPESFKSHFTSALYTGNPVREEFQKIATPEKRFQERIGPLNILVLGGSQGAKALNELCPPAFARIPLELRPFIKHQTGVLTREATENAYKSVNVLASVEPFIEDMAKAYAWADLVICRSGALTITELTAVGVGSILVPFPYAVDNHQTYNARFLAQEEAAEMISQTVLNPQRLADIIVSLSQNRSKILAMAMAARSLSKPDAGEKVVNYCIEASLGRKV